MDRSAAGVRFRSAVAGDAPGLARVQLRAALAGFAHIFPDSVPKPVLADLETAWTDLMSSFTVEVAVAGDTMVGCVAFGPETPSLSEEAQLARLYVLPEWEGRGIGGILHDLAVTRLAAAGCRTVRLWVLEGNDRARKMYERRGWTLGGERRTDWPRSGVFEVDYRLELLNPESP